MSKKCIKCGAELEENAVFCDECGMKQDAQIVTDTLSNANSTGQMVNNEKKEQSIQAMKNKNSGFGIASFVLGIVSICTFGSLFIPEILGILFGILALCEKSKKHNLAVAGLVLSLISVVIVGILLFITW